MDSAATTQMPRQVIDAVSEFSRNSRANVHRGIYALSEEATAKYEGARETVRGFINAKSANEIIFTRNTTESINLVANSFGRKFLKKGDRVLVSIAEHHSNFLPWQMLRDDFGIFIDIIDIDEDGILEIEKVKAAITPETKLASFSHISHVLGTINPILELGKIFREKGIVFLVDAAQSAGHLPIDVQKVGCDFLAFSGHKIGGPFGIGVLYGREELLKKMPPFLRGGGMISEVGLEKSEWSELPWKFEAGTPNVEGAIGLDAAIKYLKGVGFDEIRRIDEGLTEKTILMFEKIKGVKIFGPKDVSKRGGVISFLIDRLHPHDLATILDREGIAVRAGHHCAMPLMKKLGVAATSRVSFWVYNSAEDIDNLEEGIKKATGILRR